MKTNLEKLKVIYIKDTKLFFFFLLYIMTNNNFKNEIKFIFIIILHNIFSYFFFLTLQITITLNF